MTTDNKRTEPIPNNGEKMNSSKEESVQGFESIQMDDKFKNALLTTSNLVINFGYSNNGQTPVESRPASRATVQKNLTGINQLRFFTEL
jgi:hypothetical protein